MSSQWPISGFAQRHDGAALSALSLRSKASNGYGTDFIEQCRAELTVVSDDAAGRSTWIVEDDRGAAVGFFDIHVAEGAAEIEGLFVEPRAKRRGIGRRLWIKLEAEAARLGAECIMADCDPAE